MPEPLAPPVAALLREAAAGGLGSERILTEARADGDIAGLVDALTIVALHHAASFHHDRSDLLVAEAMQLQAELAEPRPIEITWALLNLGAVTARRRGDIDAAASGNQEALDRARQAGYEYGIRRSLMNLIEAQSERGHNGEAFRLLCELRDIEGLDEIERGYMHQLVADQLLELRSPDLAFEQYERSLELLPIHYRGPRRAATGLLVVAHCQRDDSERAERALARLNALQVDRPTAESQAVTITANAAVARLRGDHETAVEWCAKWESVDDPGAAEPLVLRWIMRTWAASLNDLGAHDEVIDRWGNCCGPVDDHLYRQLAVAYERSGDAESAYFAELRANEIAAGRQVSFPAAIELVEQVDIGLAIRRGSSELATANESIRRIGAEIEFITNKLLGDVSSQLAELITLFDDTTAELAELDDGAAWDRTRFDPLLEALQASLASLRERERPVTNEGTVDAASLLEHACRACDRAAVDRSIKLVRCPPEAGLRTDWAMLPGWTAQIRSAIRHHPVGSMLRVAVSVGGVDPPADADLVLDC